MTKMYNNIDYHNKSNKWCLHEQYFFKYDATAEYEGKVPMIAVDRYTKEVATGLMEISSILNALKEIEIVDNQAAFDLLFQPLKK